MIQFLSLKRFICLQKKLINKFHSISEVFVEASMPTAFLHSRQRNFRIKCHAINNQHIKMYSFLTVMVPVCSI